MPQKDIKEWACPRCQTSPCTGDACETCGATPDWKRPVKKPLESASERAERERRQKQQADEEAALQERNARFAKEEAERQRKAAEDAAKPKVKKPFTPEQEQLIEAIVARVIASK